MQQPKKAIANMYYNPLKNYGEGISIKPGPISGPVQKYLEAQKLQQPSQKGLSQGQPQASRSSRQSYEDSLDPYLARSKLANPKYEMPNHDPKTAGPKQIDSRDLNPRSYGQDQMDPLYQDPRSVYPGQFDPRYQDVQNLKKSGFHQDHDKLLPLQEQTIGDRRRRKQSQPIYERQQAKPQSPSSDLKLQQNIERFFRGHTPTRQSIARYNQTKQAMNKRARLSQPTPESTIMRDPRFYKNLQNFHGRQQQSQSRGRREQLIVPPTPKKEQPRSPISQLPIAKQKNHHQLAPAMQEKKPDSRAKQVSRQQPLPSRRSKERTIILMPMGFPLKLISGMLGQNLLITIPDLMPGSNLQNLLGMYGFEGKVSEIWVVLKGEQREKELINSAKQMSNKTRGLGVVGGRAQFIF